MVSDADLKKAIRAAFLADAATHGVRYRTVTARQADLLLAPVLIAICADERTKGSFVNAADIGAAVQEELLVLSMGAAIQNLLLMATALGLTSTWLARPARMPQMRELLGVDPWIRIVAFVALGAGGSPPPRDEHARDSIDEKIHVDRFGARSS